MRNTILCYPLGRSKKWWRCQQEPLVERDACPCSKYYTQVHGPWSPCLLPELHQPVSYPITKRGSHLIQRITQAWRMHGEGKECGQGWRYKALACLDHRERLVNPALCNSSGEALPESFIWYTVGYFYYCPLLKEKTTKKGNTYIHNT